MDKDVFDFGIHLKEIREKHGFTQQQLADKLEVHRNTIRGYESNTQLPTRDKIYMMANIFKTTADYLLGLEDKKAIYIDNLSQRDQELIMTLVEKMQENPPDTQRS